MPTYHTALLVALSALAAVFAFGALVMARRAYWKIFPLQDAQSRVADDAFRQVEALQGLYVELRLTKSLRPTRGWAASPDFLLEIARNCLDRKPRIMVDCGSGVSTVVLARCAELNGVGHVYSLDHDPGYAAQTRDELARHELIGRVTLLVAPLVAYEIGGSRWSWYDDQGVPDAPIDLLVIDGPPLATGTTARYPAIRLLQRMAPDGAAFLDDAARTDEQQVLRRWGAELPALEQVPIRCEKGCVVLRRRAAGA